MAIRHPAVVRKLVVVSVTVKHEGWYPEVLAGFAQMSPATAEPVKQSPLSQPCPHVDWAVLFTKLGLLLRQDYDWSRQVAVFQMPTLLVYADADAIRTAHIVDFYCLLGGGQRAAGLDGFGRSGNQLAILPGQTHYAVLTSPLLPPVVRAISE